MAYEVQPLPFKPHRLDGLSDRLLVSHLVGGLAAWRAMGGPTVPLSTSHGGIS
jgi:hypothetical protein